MIYVTFQRYGSGQACVTRSIILQFDFVINGISLMGATVIHCMFFYSFERKYTRPLTSNAFVLSFGTFPANSQHSSLFKWNRDCFLISISFAIYVPVLSHSPLPIANSCPMLLRINSQMYHTSAFDPGPPLYCHD